MARPRHEHPTPAELEILRILWQRGPATVRQVMGELRGPARAYTSVMSLMNVMAEKGLLARRPHGRAFIYTPKAQRDQTLGKMVGDLVQRVFDGSASALVAHLLEKTAPDELELEEIRRTIAAYKRG